MIYGLVISAGNQRRFGSEIPKSLVKLDNGSTLLDETIKRMNRYCDEVFVVCSHQNKNQFYYHNLIPIYSGMGCGDAVLKALEEFPLNLEKDDLVLIQWGDSLQPMNLYGDIISFYEGKVVIPCVWEPNPYVKIVPEENSVKVQFSKYGEVDSSGLHDLSVFFGNALHLKGKLTEFRNMIASGDHYLHKHGNEMQFLDVFNETDIAADIMEVVGYTGFSFNTKEEFEKVKYKFDFSN